MRPNSATLVGRDAALAIMLGAMVPNGSATFGNDYGFGRDYGSFGADPANQPTQANVMQAWQEKMASKARLALLQPNADSDVKIQRYAFGIGQTVTLSTAVVLAAEGKPETNFRPQRITCNVPCPAFARLNSLRVANVGVIVGGEIDAFDFAATGQDQSLDVPTISPANSVKLAGNYDGLLPDGGYVTATAFRFILSLKGPANMAGS